MNRQKQQTTNTMEMFLQIWNCYFCISVIKTTIIGFITIMKSFPFSIFLFVFTF